MAASAPEPVARPRPARADAADHGDRMPLPLQAHDVDLVLGQDVGDHMLRRDTRLGGHGPGDGPVVTGEENRGQAEGPQAADGFRAGLLDGVGDVEHRAGPAVPGNRDGRTAGLLSRVLGAPQTGRQSPRPVGRQLLPADEDGVPVDDALHPEAGDDGAVRPAA